MSWVCLKNLFENDKNFYGLLDPDVIVTVERGKHFEHLKHKNEFNEQLIGKQFKIRDLFGISNDNDNDYTKIGSPEWYMNVEGKLYNFDFPTQFTKNGPCEIPVFFVLDLTDWLKKQNKKKLRYIAECICHRHVSKDSEKIPKQLQFTFKPMIDESKKYIRGYIDVKRYNTFAKKFGLKEITI